MLGRPSSLVVTARTKRTFDMPILKNQEAADFMDEAILLELDDLRRQAARIIVDAKAKARAILDEAADQRQAIVVQVRQEASEQARTEGLAQGLDEGRRRGYDEALQQTDQQLNQLQAAWTEAADVWQMRRAQIEREVWQGAIGLAQRLAARIVHRVVEVDDQVIVDQVAAVVSHLTRPMDVSIHIHSDDRPVLERAMPKLMAKMSNLKSLRLVDDAAIVPGGCVLHYGQGQIDATLDTQLRRIAEVMVPDRTSGCSPPASPPEPTPS